ncbi:hypothetical protein GCM10017783_01130 [Deinococcus piscis]|uniref:PEGA domain-containing protein n=1 Tax=Deinococcus piscis TaxID=394230 RepID=A0ABQ3JXF7_9DEIO|nr:hypothetical protein [Deinococcus piscis]GHF93035.1 hypothetical protein GCM10017783_01130 [Deinococcus piscis]
MRRLGGYELQRNLGGTDAAQVWQGLESASESPALIFVLPAAYLLSARPDLATRHPALLPLAHSGVAEVPGENGQPGGRAAYLGSALPPGAEPLRSLDRAALLDLLGALATLHRAGAAHGGVRPELLWRRGNQVYLAGAGVPWQREREPNPLAVPDFAQDVRRLGGALADVREEADLPAGWLPALREATAPQAAQDLLARWQEEPRPELAAQPNPPQKLTATRPLVPTPPRPATPPPATPLSSAAPVTASGGVRRGVSPWPWLLTSLALAGVLAGSFWAYQNLKVPGAPLEPPACCEVRYTVRGSEVPVQLRVLDAPPQLTVDPQQAEGTAPGTMQLPGPGEYRIRVSADGYAPQTISVTVPRSLPVAIELE